MRVDRRLSIPLGVLTIAPFGYLLVYLLYLFPKLHELAVSSSPSGRAFAELSSRMMWYHLATMWLAFLLIGFYVLFAWRSRRVPREKKRPWSVWILVGNLFTMPLFWYLYIWRDRPLEPKRTLESYVSGAA